MRNPLSVLPMLLLAVAVTLVASRAAGDDYNPNGTITAGAGIRTATASGESVWQGGTKLVIQCPAIPFPDAGTPLLDGGLTQRVFYRPGGCAACPTDAGYGDYLIDFTNFPDGYPVTLRNGMSKVHLRALNPLDQVLCIVGTRSP